LLVGCSSDGSSTSRRRNLRCTPRCPRCRTSSGKPARPTWPSRASSSWCSGSSSRVHERTTSACCPTRRPPCRRHPPGFGLGNPRKLRRRVFGIRINTVANSAPRFPRLRACAGDAADPAKVRMSVGLLSGHRALLMICILRSSPPSFAGPASCDSPIGESLGRLRPQDLRRHLPKIATSAPTMMKIILRHARGRRGRNRCHRGLHRRQRRRLGRADSRRVETYGVTGVALIAFLALALGSNPPSAAS